VSENVDTLEPPEPRLGSPVAKARTRPAATSLFDGPIVRRAIGDSFRKLDPRLMIRNPVMFVVEIGSVLTTVLFFTNLGDATHNENVFAALVAAWLWFTVLFANFAEAVAEGRGRRRPTRAARHDR
jgi:K+-transporting ATPase ATPase B chain